MSWGLGWKRPSEIFRLSLIYGLDEAAENGNTSSTNMMSSSSIVSQDQELGFRIDLDWSASDDEDQVALRLQSQLMVAFPMPQDTVVVELRIGEEEGNVHVNMKVVRRREPLRVVTLTKTAGSGQQNDGTGVLARLLCSNLATPIPGVGNGAEHWQSITVLSLCGCGLSVNLSLFIIHLGAELRRYSYFSLLVELLLLFLFCRDIHFFSFPIILFPQICLRKELQKMIRSYSCILFM